MRKFHKTAAVLAAAALSVGMTGSALAAGNTGSITTGSGSQDIAVTGTYQAGSTSDKVYKVDIEWGAMAFTYTAAAQGSWNTTTHQYDSTETAGKWTPDAADGNKLTVTNHSNADVTATLSFTAETSITGLGGVFQASDSDTTNKGTFTLKSADNGTNGAAGTATSDSAYLVLSGGELSSDAAADTKIGTVTVTINDTTTP